MFPVVVVDDSAQDLALVTRVFKQCKILNPIHAFSSGLECIHYLDEKGPYSDRKPPCLLVVDLIMSPTSGLDVLRHLRSSKLSDATIAVMLSGLQDVKAIREGYELGAVTFLLKPVKVEDVMQMLGALKRLTVQSVPDGCVLLTSPPPHTSLGETESQDTAISLAGDV